MSNIIENGAYLDEVILPDACRYRGDLSSSNRASPFWYMDEANNEFVSLEKEQIVNGNDNVGERDDESLGPENNAASGDTKIMYCFRYYPYLNEVMCCYQSTGRACTEDARSSSLVGSPMLPIFSSSAITKPILVKLSIDKSFVAIQISKTIVIVAMIGERKTDPWAINLTGYNPSAQSSSANTVPLHGIISTYKGNEFLIPITFDSHNLDSEINHILPNAIIWSDHGGNSQDLILVTSKSVLFYKVSRVRQKLERSRVYAHANDSFYFDSKTRTLLCGELSSSSHESTHQSSGGRASLSSVTEAISTAIILRTYFLRTSTKDAPTSPSLSTLLKRDYNYQSKFSLLPSRIMNFRSELPPPDVLPLFIVGSLTGIDRGLRRVALNDIRLVNLYGEPYFVYLKRSEIGCLEVYHLDRAKNEIHRVFNFNLGFVLDASTQIYVLDNLLCVQFSNKEVALFDIGLKDFSQALVITSINNYDCVKHDVVDISQRYSPSNTIYIARRRDDCKMFLLKLNLEVLMHRRVLEDKNLVSFLLKRKTPNNLSKGIVLDGISNMIERSDEYLSYVYRNWAGDIANFYRREIDSIWGLDMNIQLQQIPVASLLPDVLNNSSAIMLENENVMEHPHLLDIISQSDCVRLLIRRAVALVASENCFDSVTCISTKRALCGLVHIAFALRLALEERNIPISIALECIIVSMLWRLNRLDECISFIHNDCLNSVVSDEDISKYSLGKIIFAETMLKMCSESPYSSSSEKFLRIMMNYAIEVLFDCDVPNLAARYLLDSGLIMDAIKICERSLQYRKSDIDMHEIGPCAQDFFVTTTKVASKITDMNERVRLFYRLSSFLHEWDADAVLSRSNDGINFQVCVHNQFMGDLAAGDDNSVSSEDDADILDGRKYSVLSENVPFPDELFGGEESKEAFTLRKLYGYPTPFFSFFDLS